MQSAVRTTWNESHDLEQDSVLGDAFKDLFLVLGQKWLLITPVYPSEACPLGPSFQQNVRVDRTQLLPGDGPQRAGFRWVNDPYTNHCQRQW